jgi:hypothetical protein
MAKVAEVFLNASKLGLTKKVKQRILFPLDFYDL